MELKKYQQKTLEILGNFLNETREFGPKHAFISITDNPYKEQYYGKTPFICIKIPTGGGKTLVGCHSVTQIMDKFLQEKLGRGIVMWFVPSEAIFSQTLTKFRNRNDIHRKLLDEYFGNNVKIFSTQEALRIRKEDLEDNICIIISSLDAFRKETQKREGYKVYQENGGLMNHFEEIEDNGILEKDENGTVINSLSNVIRLNSPLIVIDEGHKTKTALSIDFLKDLNPSFIIEYTATPRPESNVLVEIHSSELKEENMVKLPLVLESHTQWQTALLQGILKREELEKLAMNDGIRPIALIQAQQEKEDERKITVSKIKEFLITDRKIPKEQIAIKTSKENELQGLDLFASDCQIRYIITVNALAEGWDCSFAYLLVSVANIGSKIAVEQIIGRIMRMPFAKRREIEDLNRSYVFASAKRFSEASDQIISGLEDHGFSKLDLVSSTEKKGKYPFDIERKIKEDFSIPILSLGDDPLSFEDLIGEKFEIHNQIANFDFQVHYDNDGKALMDINEKDKWIKGKQTALRVTYKDKNCSKDELVNWLDNKLRFTMLEKDDKVKFINKVISQIKKYSLQQLSINRYVLREKLEEIIRITLEDYAKVQFEQNIKTGKIKAKEFDRFPDYITLQSELSQEFNKNYYGKIDKLNREELSFIERVDLDSLDNINFWIRNREKKDPFFLQGWKRGKYYPDFIAYTKSGNIVALEWKGEDRLGNEDTKYKTELAKVWETLGGGKLHYLLAHNGNIERVLDELKKL